MGGARELLLPCSSHGCREQLCGELGSVRTAVHKVLLPVSAPMARGGHGDGRRKQVLKEGACTTALLGQGNSSSRAPSMPGSAGVKGSRQVFPPSYACSLSRSPVPSTSPGAPATSRLHLRYDTSHFLQFTGSKIEAHRNLGSLGHQLAGTGPGPYFLFKHLTPSNCNGSWMPTSH